MTLTLREQKIYKILRSMESQVQYLPCDKHKNAFEVDINKKFPRRDQDLRTRIFLSYEETDGVKTHINYFDPKMLNSTLDLDGRTDDEMDEFERDPVLFFDHLVVDILISSVKRSFYFKSVINSGRGKEFSLTEEQHQVVLDLIRSKTNKDLSEENTRPTYQKSFDNHLNEISAYLSVMFDAPRNVAVIIRKNPAREGSTICFLWSFD